MIAASGLRWILSLVFAVPVLYGVWLMVLPGTGMAERVDHALHSAMGVLMIAMAWPWGMDIPAAPQVVLFSVGGLWFVAAAPFRAGDRTWGRAELAALPHVVMMGATIGTWAEAYGPEEGVYASLFAFSQEAADRLEGVSSGDWRGPGKSARPRKLDPRPEDEPRRLWARTNGYLVSDRGRIPAAIRETYEASQR